MAEQMKGITVCGDCVYYSMKKHRCTRGCTDEGDARAHFYVDCPLPDVVPVRHGKWEVWNDDKNTFECSKCGMAFTLNEGTPKDNDYNYCPNCGADMRPSEEPESLTCIPPEERSGVDDD